MLFAPGSAGVLTLHDRSSNVLLAVRPPSKAAAPIAGALAQAVLTPLPPPWRQTVSLIDNGTEFARHYRLHEPARPVADLLLRDPHAPLAEAAPSHRERAIGRLDAATPAPQNAPQSTLVTPAAGSTQRLVQAYNNTPRKCLGYQTPQPRSSGDATMVHSAPGCESTFPPSRE